jgi:excisionase family DNA binding protein
MMTTAIDRDRFVPPRLTESETEMVKAAERAIMASLDHSRAATITIESDDGSTPSVSVPPQVLRVLGQTLGLMARNQPIMLVPEKQELSTVEAANFLNVSRPFVVKEIDAGRLQHRMVGTHRRVMFSDLLDYAKNMRAKQQEALDKMADNARELGLEY